MNVAVDNIEEALFELFTTAPEISALIDDRFFPIERPQGSALPAITYNRTGGNLDYAMDGATGLVDSRFLLFCFGEANAAGSAYLNAKRLKREVLKVIAPLRSARPAGGVPARQIGNVQIQGIFVQDESDSRADGSQGVSKLARVQIDFTIWHLKTGD